MRVAVFDLDGTLSRRDLFLAFLAMAVRRHGPARPVATAGLPVLSARFMLRGIGNERLKCAWLDALIGGRPRALLAPLAESFAARALLGEIKPAALRAIEEHRRAGDALVLATASLDLYAAPIAARLGFDAALATRIAWTPDGRVAGGLAGPNLRGAAKRDEVEALLALRFPRAAEVIAYTDHESDLPLLEAATRPLAVDPTRALRAIARARGWPILAWGAPAPRTPRHAALREIRP